MVLLARGGKKRGSVETDEKSRPTYHCALKKEGAHLPCVGSLEGGKDWGRADQKPHLGTATGVEV